MYVCLCVKVHVHVWRKKYNYNTWYVPALPVSLILSFSRFHHQGSKKKLPFNFWFPFIRFSSIFSLIFIIFFFSERYKASALHSNSSSSRIESILRGTINFMKIVCNISHYFSTKTTKRVHEKNCVFFQSSLLPLHHVFYM